MMYAWVFKAGLVLGTIGIVSRVAVYVLERRRALSKESCERLVEGIKFVMNVGFYSLAGLLLWAFLNT